MTRKDIFNSMDEFEQYVFIANFIRNLPPEINVYTRLGASEAKERFRKYLNEEVTE